MTRKKWPVKLRLPSPLARFPIGQWKKGGTIRNDNREFNRESKNLTPPAARALVQSNKELQSIAAKIPYAREQGIF
jgi:hypothetical protein